MLRAQKVILIGLSSLQLVSSAPAFGVTDQKQLSALLIKEEKADKLAGAKDAMAAPSKVDAAALKGEPISQVHSRVPTDGMNTTLSTQVHSRISDRWHEQDTVRALVLNKAIKGVNQAYKKAKKYAQIAANSGFEYVKDLEEFGVRLEEKPFVPAFAGVTDDVAYSFTRTYGAIQVNGKASLNVANVMASTATEAANTVEKYANKVANKVEIYANIIANWFKGLNCKLSSEDFMKIFTELVTDLDFHSIQSLFTIDAVEKMNQHICADIWSLFNAGNPHSAVLKNMITTVANSCKALSGSKLGLVMGIGVDGELSGLSGAVELGLGWDLDGNEFCVVSACIGSSYSFPPIVGAGSIGVSMTIVKDVSEMEGRDSYFSLGVGGTLIGDFDVSLTLEHSGNWLDFTGIGFGFSVGESAPYVPVKIAASASAGVCWTPMCITTEGYECGSGTDLIQDDGDFQMTVRWDDRDYECGWEDGYCTDTNCPEKFGSVQFAPDFCNEHFGDYLIAQHCNPSGKQDDGCTFKCCTLPVDIAATISLPSPTLPCPLRHEGNAISGDNIGDKFYYNEDGCECVSKCQDLDGCVAFVDNKLMTPPYCAFKSSTDGIYDNSAKDVYMMSCAETNKVTGKAISGGNIGDIFYYNEHGCECVSKCQDLDGCVAFVDNKLKTPPYCAFKSSTVGIYDNSAKDVYMVS